MYHRFIYTCRRATVSGHRLVVGVPSCRGPRRSDDSIVRASSVYRDNPAEVEKERLAQLAPGNARRYTCVYVRARACERTSERATWIRTLSSLQARLHSSASFLIAVSAIACRLPPLLSSLCRTPPRASSSSRNENGERLHSA